MMKHLILGTLFITSLSAFAEDSVFLLTKSLDFSSSPGLHGAKTLQVGKHPTLMKKISESNGVTKVQVLQVNGHPSDKTLYISSKWFEKGTNQSAVEFHVDPNKIVNAPQVHCDPPKVSVVQSPIPNLFKEADACEVLDNGSSDVDAHVKCFDAIKKKLDIQIVHSAYGAISKLYSLTPSEQRFMALIFTMYGEARGERPTEAQMAAVMKVVENRTRVAKELYPGSNELDVVLQNSQFSMFNTRDNNWRQAFKASGEDLRDAIKVFAEKQSNECEVKPPSFDEDNVFHYATSNTHRPWMNQGKKVNFLVDGVQVNKIGGHFFYANVPWPFNPNNKYKSYAKQKGYLE